MRNPDSNLERGDAPGIRAKNYFTSDIQPYTDESGLFTRHPAASRHSHHNCAFCQLRLSALGFAPSFARSGARGRVFSTSDICETNAALRRAERPVVSASCCPVCQKFWRHFERFDLSDEAKNQSIHTLYRSLQSLVDLVFDAPHARRAEVALVFADSSRVTSECDIIQQTLTSAFQQEAIQPRTEDD